MTNQVVTIDYTNWRGERATRRVKVIEFRFGRTDWHPDPQWLFDAVDIDRGVLRTFAVVGVHSWRAHDVATAVTTGPLASLYEDVRKYLTGDAFWIAEILLAAIERETGFKGEPRDRRDYEHG